MTDRPAAVVTGAARGIGRATATALAGAGHSVLVADRDADAGRAVVLELQAAGAEASFLQVDMARAEDAESLVDGTLSAFGRLDVLVNNAAVTRVIDLFDVQVADWDELTSINSRGYFLALQAVARHMRDNGGGSIVNVASIAAKGWRNTTNIAYASSKGAVVTMTRIAAATLGKHGIRVNAVCPGMTRTDMMQDWISKRAAELGTTTPELIESLTDHVALGRLVEPAEVAATVVFLASPASAAITGQSLNVDCGTVWD